MSSIKMACASFASSSESRTQTEQPDIQAQSQIRKKVYKGPPLSTSVIDYSTIPVSLDVLSYPLEDEMMHALYQKRAREAEWCGPPSESLVVDFGNLEDCRHYYDRRGLSVADAQASKRVEAVVFDKHCVAEKRTKKGFELGKKKDKGAKKVWALYGKLKTRA